MLTRSLSLTSAMGSRRSLFISSLLCAAILLLSWFFSDVQARAEIRIVTASGEHRMGDRDTREDAIKLAAEAAKRNALEQVATYLESVTVVRDLDVTQDEIRTYTAGVVLVLDQHITTSLDGETVVIRVDLTAQVDSEDVIRAIAALRKNEDAREELVALKAEVDRLHQELDAANHALAEAASPEQVRKISRLRQDILDKVQSNALVSQAWTDWVIVSPFVGFSPWVNAASIQALLAQAEQLNPSNPHVRVVQQVLTARVPPTPPQPPAPPAPPHTTLAMPTYQVVPQQPLPLSSPPTLNQLLQAPMKQPGASSPPADQQPTAPQPASSSLSRRLSTMTHLTPFLLAPPGSITGSAPPPTPQTPPMPDSPHTSSRNLSPMLQHTPATMPASPPTVRGTLPAAKVLPAPDGATLPRKRRLSPGLDRLFAPQGAGPHLPRESPHVRPFPPGRGLSESQGGPGHKGAK
ncbi:MAG TPA: hypothetical protein VNK46_09290 [Nitrospiraceae bacterium]|jgi:hypothetical protein|nr:hypothetical protein [Nitrospiraceae bacterium]